MTAAGKALGLAFGAVSRMRPDKPLHPRGSVVRMELERTGAPTRWGVPWLDEPGHHTGLARLSRSLGLPAGWPDVLGLALRFETDRPHDLLLSTTGAAPGLRHVLVPHRDPASGFYGTVLPYDTPAGSVLLAVRPTATPRRFELLVAGMTKPWEAFGTVTLSEASFAPEDRLVDLDAVRNPLPGLAPRGWVAALREPAYAAARQGRAHSA